MVWKDGFTDAFSFAINLLLGLAYIVKIVLVKYKKDTNVNKLTFLPYYVVLVYLSVLGVTEVIQSFEFDENLNRYIDVVNCFFWSNIALVIIFEWEIITVLVCF